MLTSRGSSAICALQRSPPESGEIQTAHLPDQALEPFWCFLTAVLVQTTPAAYSQRDTRNSE